MRQLLGVVVAKVEIELDSRVSVRLLLVRAFPLLLPAQLQIHRLDAFDFVFVYRRMGESMAILTAGKEKLRDRELRGRRGGNYHDASSDGCTDKQDGHAG